LERVTTGIGCRGIRSPTFAFRRARIRAAALADPAPEANPVGRTRELAGLPFP